MSFDSWLNKTIDDNEHFLGEELDQEKMDRLNRLRDLSARFAKGERGVSYSAFPFSNRSRNAMITIDVPSVFFTASSRSMQTISEITALSDFVSFAVVADGKIRIGFGVHDMWTKFGYTNDMEHGK